MSKYKEWKYGNDQIHLLMSEYKDTNLFNFKWVFAVKLVIAITDLFNFVLVSE